MSQVTHYHVIVSKIQGQRLGIQPPTLYEIAIRYFDNEVDKYCIWIQRMKGQ